MLARLVFVLHSHFAFIAHVADETACVNDDIVVGIMWHAYISKSQKEETSILQGTTGGQGAYTLTSALRVAHGGDNPIPLPFQEKVLCSIC